MARNPLFLQRRSYRFRRMMDALRFLPFIGLALWMVPLLWPGTQDVGAMPLSSALLYIFGIWFFLVLAAWALWLRTREATGNDDTRGPEAD